MTLDVKQALFEQLAWHWEAQLRPRLDGLTDEEYFWEPAPNCWTVRRVGDGWMPDSGLEPATPPFTTIAWRICHIGSVLGARASYHFGDRSWRRDSVAWPGTAEDALVFLDGCWHAWSQGIDAIDPERLQDKSEGPPHTLDAQFAFAEVILHVNREVIHHGAEVALLRDLWRSTRPQDPFVAACLRGDRAEVEAIRAREPGIVERMREEHPALVMRATEGGNAAAVRLLAELGFELETATTPRPLHYAAGSGDLEVVRALVEAGADPSAVDDEYRATALGWAEHFGQDEVARYLRSLGERSRR